MTRFEKEKRLLRRKILFILVLVMNEVMIYFMGDEFFFGYKVKVIGNWIRVVLVIMIIISILFYFKEKALKLEVRSKGT